MSNLRTPWLAVLLAVLTLAHVGLSSAQVTTATFDLQGPVAHVREFREFPGTTDRQLLVERSFEAEGRITELVTFSYSFRDGSLSGRQVTTYDGEGRRTLTVALDADGATVGRTEYRYDADGRQVSEVATDAAGTETRRIEVERDGDRLVQVWYQGGALFRRTESTVDEDGQPVTWRNYDGEERLLLERTYSVPGLAFEYVEYDAEGAVKERGSVRSGEHGGFEVATVYSADGTLTYEMTWQYDDDGLVLEQREVDAGGEEIVFRHTYAFDHVGNWVRHEQTEDMGSGPEVYEVRDREISYR
jgi:hypothetical protein